MKIKDLHIQNFRGFEDLKIQFPDTNLAVFIGENGSGKSSVLDCLSLGLFNILADVFDFSIPIKDKSLTDEDYLVLDAISDLMNHEMVFRESSINPKDIKYGKYSVFYSLNYIWNNLESNFYVSINPSDNSRFRKSILKNKLDISKELAKNINFSFPTLIYYRTNRDSPTPELEIQSNLSLRQFSTYQNSFDYPSLNPSSIFFDWFKEEEAYEKDMKLEGEGNLNYVNPNLEVIRKSINSFLNSFSKDKYENIRTNRVRKGNSFNTGFNAGSLDTFLAINKNGEIFHFDQLSSGEKMLLMLVADIARRLAIANPSLQGAEALNGEGIVLIDEIELHLHPSWQREVIPALRKTFPNIQFIITTHSPQVLSGIKKVDEDSIFILKDWQVYKPSSSPVGRDSNGILEEIMGVSKRPLEVEMLIEEYFSAINQLESEKSDQIRKKLESELSFDDPFFAQADAILKRKMLLGR